MSMQNEIYFMGATQIPLSVLGASVFPTQIKPPQFCVGMQYKIITGGGTVQILPNAIANQTISGATAVIGGYPLVTGEMYPIVGPAAFYIAATGATATVALNFFFSSGATLN